MNFQDLAQVETAEAYLDHALKQGVERVSKARSLVKGRGAEKQRKLEQQRLRAVTNALTRSLLRIATRFPDLDGLTEFYAQLVNATLDVAKLRQALAAPKWAASRIRELEKEFVALLGRAEKQSDVLRVKRQALGRVSSVVKQINPRLRFLEDARKTMRTYPSLKDCFTVAIAGFPNVGKSTLLGRLTPAKPKIGAYAFTTKTLNVGYATHHHCRVQFVDTPGTLARPEKMNLVERQADLAMRYAAHAIVYVYDLTEPFPLADQRRLERKVRGLGKPVLVYYSKRDLLGDEAFAGTEGFTDAGELWAALAALAEKY